MTDNVTPLFPREDRFTNRTTAANSIYKPENHGPNVNSGERYEVDPMDVFSTRALWATALGLIVALIIIAVLP